MMKHRLKKIEQQVQPPEDYIVIDTDFKGGEVYYLNGEEITPEKFKALNLDRSDFINPFAD